jgi:hypothetical protein
MAGGGEGSCASWVSERVGPGFGWIRACYESAKTAHLVGLTPLITAVKLLYKSCKKETESTGALAIYGSAPQERDPANHQLVWRTEICKMDLCS